MSKLTLRIGQFFFDAGQSEYVDTGEALDLLGEASGQLQTAQKLATLMKDIGCQYCNKEVAHLVQEILES
jgi:hypothetical protein